MELGSLIKQHRSGKGMSQDDLARAIFVSRQTVSNWETGKTYPDVQSLLLMSDLFGVSIDQLVKGDMEMIDAEIEKAAKRMKMLAQVMWVFALFAIVVPTLGLFRWGWQTAPSLVILVLGWGIAMAAAIAIEKIKKSYELVTYQDIAAFMNGEASKGRSDEAALGHSHPLLASLAKVVVGALVGAAIALVAILVAKSL